MTNYNNQFSKAILSLPRYSKRIIAMFSDLALCILCTWLAFFLRLDVLILFKDFNFFPAIISVVIAIPIFWLFGLYRTIFRYTSLSIIFTISASIFIYGLLYFLVISVYGIEGVPRSIGILQPILLLFAIICLRLVVKYLLLSSYSSKEKKSNKKNVLIYGAGEAGRQLVIALENNLEFKIIGFLDDNSELHRQVLLGQKIYSPLNLEKMIRTKDVSLVFLALPSISRNKRNQIIEKLTNLN